MIKINLLDLSARKKKVVTKEEQHELLQGATNLDVSKLKDYYAYLNKDTAHLKRFTGFKLIDVVNNTTNDYCNLYTLPMVYKDYMKDIKYDVVPNRDFFAKIIAVFLSKVVTEMAKNYAFNTPVGRFVIAKAKLPAHRRYTDFGKTREARLATGDNEVVVLKTDLEYHAVAWYSNYMKNAFMYRFYSHNDLKSIVKGLKDTINKHVIRKK